MTTGADKRIVYDPPGAIGLIDSAAGFYVRFDETETAQRPQDALGVCDDFDVAIGTTVMPEVVSAALGRGRSFNGTTRGLAARDKDSGATLFTRDLSIQVVLSWDAATQFAHQPGVLVCRGLSVGSAEYVAYGLRLDVVDAAAYVCSLRWFWQDVAGVDRLQTGAQITIPPNQFTMVTATRRWVSPTEVELSYYVGDQLAGSVTSSDGSIGGGTTGAMQIGFRRNVVNGNFYAGIIDELMIMPRELSPEEVEATWLRITVYQPRGTKLFLESFDPDFPMSDDPSSDIQLDIRMTGQGLGYAGAQIETLRSNFLPQRAYGSTLEQWEQAVAVTPKPAQGIESRRARVLSRLRQRLGVSIPGIKEALSDLLDCDVDDLRFISYSNTIIDGFDTSVEPMLWDTTPVGSAVWNAGVARIAPGIGDWTLSSTAINWRTMALTVSQPVTPEDPMLGVLGGEHALSKLVYTTPQSGVEAGVWMGDKGLNNYILLGLLDDAGVFKVVTETFVAGVSGGLVVQSSLGANPAAIWLHLRQDGSSGGWIPAWSVVGPTLGYSVGSTIAHPALVHWAGCYVRGNAVGAPTADFDDFQLFTPNGTRPFNAYVYRPESLGGQPDLEGAHSVLRAMKHAYTHADIITSLALLNNNPDSRCGRGPMGAL